MGMTYLWDTNIVIYYLQQQLSPAAARFIDSTLLYNAPALSVVSEIELLCWRNATEEQRDVLQGFIYATVVFGLSDKIKRMTVDIRRACNVKLPDAIIAATALTYDCTLLTSNTKDFKTVSGLHVIDPTRHDG